MKLPEISEPQRLAGLYVFDFGAWSAVGYTAEEIALLLESEQFRGGKVYKIHRAQPDGSMELRGVAAERFELEAGLFFYRAALDAARADFERLVSLADAASSPGRAFVHLADLGPAAERQRYVVALIYPAEYDEEFAAWLSQGGYGGGDTVEGGISAVTHFYQQTAKTLERHQLWSRPAIPSRSREDVYASVRRAVQR